MTKKFIGALCLAAMASGTGWAQNFDIDPGKWEFEVIVNMQGITDTQFDSMCTTEEDLNQPILEFVNDTAKGFSCSATNLNQTGNLYTADLSCDADSMLKNGEVVLMTSSKAFSLTLQGKSIISTGEKDVLMSLLSYRAGSC